MIYMKLGPKYVHFALIYLTLHTLTAVQLLPVLYWPLGLLFWIWESCFATVYN